MVNYSRELRIRADIRRKRKVEKVIKFAENLKRKLKTVLKKAQKEIKILADKERKKA